MKRGEHACAVAGCDNACPRGYPMCSSCWYRVPPELRRAVRAGLRQGDESALRDAVARAAASVAGLGRDEPAPMTEAVFNWELAYLKAGSPSLKERGRNQ